VSPWLIHASSPVDPTCNVSEVTRLLWTMIVVSSVAGLITVLRPSVRWVVGLVVAAPVWMWIDMEGPVLVSRGSHGLHVADVPVVIAFVAVVIAGARLWRRRSAGRRADE
jgi:hypothetical protein